MVERAFTPVTAASVHSGQRGFTLVELMVAMTGGLFLSIIVFALSRDASRFYQQETRLANATLSGVTGFERLSNDIARAGHLVTPNIDSDPRVCNRPVSAWPDRIEHLRAIKIDTDQTKLAGSEVAIAGVTPMAIELAGALDVTDELTITQIGPIADGFAVYVRLDTPAASRLGLVAAATPAQNQAVLKSIFMPNNHARAVRITQLDGMEQYAMIKDVVASPELRIELAAAPALSFRTSAADSVQCGIQGFNTGGSLSIVNFVRYELRRLKGNATYDPLFAASDSQLNHDAGRVELVRVELNPGEGDMDGTLEIISEYAVNLQFSMLKAETNLNTNLVPVAAVGIDGTYTSTQLLRGVHASLSVRSREADRITDVSGATPATYRFPLNVGTKDQVELSHPERRELVYARMRTFQSDVPLRNLESSNW